MIEFKSNLPLYFKLQMEQECNNAIMQQVLNYLSSGDITPMGFYALLENNHISNPKSIKLLLLNSFFNLKKKIQLTQQYITTDQLMDLQVIQNLWQINLQDLKGHKQQELSNILALQKYYFTYIAKQQDLETEQNIKALKKLLGMQVEVNPLLSNATFIYSS